ncbi:hypothetical protein LCM20_09830 [Halobacillus litoralis]|uniref:hypothetical protein n=1 Tax=Halobacillus litoralis TaxID=45668 RepID=UPI001CD808D8|nr:hypothetical protein [Halobacillus litoralis]MCA0970889.1 hypothetical protein [Halobacillus litoralis]
MTYYLLQAVRVIGFILMAYGLSIQMENTYSITLNAMGLGLGFLVVTTIALEVFFVERKKE